MASGLCASSSSSCGVSSSAAVFHSRPSAPFPEDPHSQEVDIAKTHDRAIGENHHPATVTEPMLPSRYDSGSMNHSPPSPLPAVAFMMPSCCSSVCESHLVGCCRSGPDSDTVAVTLKQKASLLAHPLTTAKSTASASCCPFQCCCPSASSCYCVALRQSVFEEFCCSSLHQPSFRPPTPFGLHRTVLLLVYMFYNALATYHYQNWVAISHLLFEASVYHWKCPRGEPPEVSGATSAASSAHSSRRHTYLDDSFSRSSSTFYHCQDQNVAVQCLFSFCLVGDCAGAVLGGVLLDHVGMRYTAVIGMVIQSAGWVLIGYSGESLDGYRWGFLLVTLGMSVAYLAPVSVTHLFPRTLGLAVALLQLAASYSAFVPVVLLRVFRSFTVLDDAPRDGRVSNSVVVPDGHEELLLHRFKLVCVVYVLVGPLLCGCIAVLFMPVKSFQHQEAAITEPCGSTADALVSAAGLSADESQLGVWENGDEDVDDYHAQCKDTCAVEQQPRGTNTAGDRCCSVCNRASHEEEQEEEVEVTDQQTCGGNVNLWRSASFSDDAAQVTPDEQSNYSEGFCGLTATASTLKTEASQKDRPAEHYGQRVLQDMRGGSGVGGRLSPSSLTHILLLTFFRRNKNSLSPHTCNPSCADEGDDDSALKPGSADHTSTPNSVRQLCVYKPEGQAASASTRRSASHCLAGLPCARSIVSSCASAASRYWPSCCLPAPPMRRCNLHLHAHQARPSSSSSRDSRAWWLRRFCRALFSSCTERDFYQRLVSWPFVFLCVYYSVILACYGFYQEAIDTLVRGGETLLEALFPLAFIPLICLGLVVDFCGVDAAVLAHCVVGFLTFAVVTSPLSCCTGDKSAASVVPSITAAQVISVVCCFCSYTIAIDGLVVCYVQTKFAATCFGRCYGCACLIAGLFSLISIPLFDYLTVKALRSNVDPVVCGITLVLAALLCLCVWRYCGHRLRQLPAAVCRRSNQLGNRRLLLRHRALPTSVDEPREEKGAAIRTAIRTAISTDENDAATAAREPQEKEGGKEEEEATAATKRETLCRAPSSRDIVTPL